MWGVIANIWELRINNWETVESCELGITETMIRCILVPPSILLAESAFATSVCSKRFIEFLILVASPTLFYR